MTPRERLLAALRHENPDRVPLDLWIRHELMEDIRQHLGLDDEEAVLQYLGVDVRSTWIGQDQNPEFKEKLAAQGRDGASHLWHDDRTFEDDWGIVQRHDETQTYVEWVSGPLVGVESSADWSPPAIELIHDGTAATERTAKLKAAGFPVMGGVGLCFKQGWHLRGLENLMADFYVNKDLAHDVLEKITDWQEVLARRYARAGIDIFTITGDIAMQDRLMFSPEAFREFLKPRMQRLYDAIRDERSKMADEGVPGGEEPVYTYYHCDGNLEEIIPDLIEIGLDILNPIQPECMDPAKIKREYGKDLVLHGSISIQETLPNGTEQDVRDEVRLRIDTCGEGGGFVCGPANVTQNDTPVANILAMYDEAKSYSTEFYSEG